MWTTNRVDVDIKVGNGLTDTTNRHGKTGVGKSIGKCKLALTPFEETSVNDKLLPRSQRPGQRRQETEPPKE